MATTRTRAGGVMQIIPTNVGGRTFATPPRALQDDVVPNDLFYVRNHWKDVPQIDIATYRLTVGGLVERPLSLSFDDIKKLPERRFQVTLECCGNGPVPEYWLKRTRNVMERLSGHGLLSNAEWAGVSLSQVLEMAGVKSNAVDVVFSGADHGPDEVADDPPEVTYERSLPVDKALHPDTILAYEMNGEPLPPMHGYPLRLLVPGWYGMNSIKWLMGIHVIDHAFDGFYQIERYRVVNGPDDDSYYTYLNRMKVKSIVTDPAPGEVVPTGDEYTVSGAAWSGENEVVRVDVSTDSGQTWNPARLIPRTDYSWYRWEFNWQPPAPGNYVLMSRATNDKGDVQPMDFPNKYDGIGYGNNMVFEHMVEVRDL